MQILGQNLDATFEKLEIQAVKVVETEKTKYKDSYQVWELDELAMEKLESSGDDWESKDGWWRFGGCIYEGAANVEYTVNGYKMMGYESQNIYEELGEESWYQDTFSAFEEFMATAMNLTNTSNFAYFAMSLARDNGLTLAEFMRKYQNEDVRYKISEEETKEHSGPIIISNLMVRKVIQDTLEDNNIQTPQDLADLLLLNHEDEIIFLDGWKKHVDMEPYDVNNMPGGEEE